MRDMYLSWPSQIRNALGSWGGYAAKRRHDSVLIVGMGGSGIVGDYVAALAMQLGGPSVAVIKSHLLPRNAGDDALVISVSYSGNTHETIIATKEAIERGLETVIVSSGGYLKALAEKRGLLHVPLPPGLAPRASLPSMLFSVLGLLDASGMSVVSKGVAEGALQFLEGSVADIAKKGDEIAEWIWRAGGLLTIATHSPLDPLAIRAKNEFNENSKVIAKVDVAPEWMHNDIVGYEGPLPVSPAVIELIDPGDEVGRKLVEFMEKIYLSVNGKVLRVELLGDNLLEKMLYGSLLLGIASCRLAELRGVDPLETRGIKEYKGFASAVFKV